MHMYNYCSGLTFLFVLLVNKGYFGEVVDYPTLVNILCILGLITVVTNSHKIYKLKKGGLPWI